MTKPLLRPTKRIGLAMVCLGLVSCGPNEAILKSNRSSPTPAVPSDQQRPSENSIESEVEAMRNADFDYIFVFRRRDGGEMTSEDRSLIKDSTPNANRRTLAANGKAIVIGSNSWFTKELLAELAKRFEVQNFSKPEADIKRPPEAANANMNR